MYGRMTSGASVWPMNVLAAIESDSAPLAFISLAINQAIPCTIRCMIPR